MFDSLVQSPDLVFALGALAVLVLAIPAVLWLVNRLKGLEGVNVRLAAELEQGREILAAVPDGLFLWDHARAEERCSRRLAVLLGLKAGTGAAFRDVLAMFSEADALALKQAVDQLHVSGASFDLLVKLGSRTIQAAGTRASTLDGKPLNDLMWMRDVTGGKSPAAASQPETGTSALDHFHQLLDTLPLPVWIRDGGLEVVFSNRADSHIAASSLSRLLAEQARSEGQTFSESHFIDREERAQRFDVSEAPARGWNGTVGFALEMNDSDDITPVGLTPAESGVLDNLSTAVAVFNRARRLSYCNGAYAALWRFDPDWLGDSPSWSEILDRLRQRRQLPEVADFRAFKEEQSALFENLRKPAETLLHLPDGRTLRTVVAPHGAGGLVFSYEDVSDQLDLERSFKTLNAVQRETLDNLYEGIAVFGSDGRLKLSNPAFADLWGLTQPALTGEPHMSDILNATRALTAGVETWSNEQWRTYVGNQLARFTARQAANGRIQLSNDSILEYSSVPLPDGAVLLSYLDVSDSARVEAALRQRAEALSQANRLKSEFIANVSYEVRAPLTTLKGFADILAQEYFGQLNTRQKEYCQGILDSAQGLTSVINDILDMASIEAGMMTLELDTVEIHSMLASVLNLTNERARRKALEIDFDCPSDIGWIVADEKRLKQVLFYLLSNAVNVSPMRGAVRLKAERSMDGDDSFIHFMVSGRRDSAAETEQLDIFQAFDANMDVEGPPADSVQMGAGLGLTLVRRFVELHGGTVDVKSPQGRGTTITCRLPAAGANHDGVAGLAVVGE